MHFPPWVLGARLYGIVLSFRAIMDILVEGKISLILLLGEPGACHRWKYHRGDGIDLNGAKKGQNLRQSYPDE